MGLVDPLVPQDQVRQAAMEMATDISKAGRPGVQPTRETLNLDLIQAFRATPEREMFEQTALRQTKDYKQGVTASFGRRNPAFTAT